MIKPQNCGHITCVREMGFGKREYVHVHVFKYIHASSDKGFRIHYIIRYIARSIMAMP